MSVWRVFVKKPLWNTSELKVSCVCMFYGMQLRSSYVHLVLTEINIVFYWL